MRRTLREPISRPAWQILVSFGLAILMISGLLFYALWYNDRQVNQDLCDLVSVFATGPEPVDGPNGERSRFVREAMDRFRDRRACPPG